MTSLPKGPAARWSSAAVWLIRDRIRAGALVALFPDQPSIRYETHALWPETRHLPFRVRLVIDALAKALPATAELSEATSRCSARRA